MRSRVSVRDLTKVFARHHATRRRGVTTEGAAALTYLVKQTMRPAHKARMPRRDARHVWALDGVSFDVPPGEVLGIIGRNGAGKSTLLKILARVLQPTRGRAVIHGRVVSMLELGIGFAPELTVRENLQVHGRLAGIAPRLIDAAEPGILEFAGLTTFRDVPLQKCPSGSVIQLGFAAAMGLGADVILADEVLAVGDAMFRQACETRVRAAGESGASVLFVSHDMAAIRRICSRVIWIDHGRIVRVGAPGDVVDAYTSELLAGRLMPPLNREGLAASCALVDTRLLDERGAPVGALQLTEPGYIDCLVQLSRPDVAVVVEIQLWQGRHHVLTSASRSITALRTTTFRAGVRIPAHFLNELSYRAKFRLHVTDLSKADAETVVAAEGHLNFAAMNPHPENSVWNDWSWARQGVISPKLPWTMAVDVTPAQTHRSA